MISWLSPTSSVGLWPAVCFVGGSARPLLRGATRTVPGNIWVVLFGVVFGGCALWPFVLAQPSFSARVDALYECKKGG